MDPPTPMGSATDSRASTGPGLASRIGLGGAAIGNLFHPVSEGDARALLDRAWADWCRRYDTAPHYGHGLSEHRMGEALRARPRADITLSSKVGRLLTPRATVPREQFSYVDTPTALDAVLRLLPVDDFESDPVRTMQVVGDPLAVPAAVSAISQVLARHAAPAPAGFERHAFYAAAARATLTIRTGEMRPYGNVLVRKGVLFGPALGDLHTQRNLSHPSPLRRLHHPEPADGHPAGGTCITYLQRRT